MNAFLSCSMFLAGLTACTADMPDGAGDSRPEDHVALHAEPTGAPLSYIADGDTVVVRLDMGRIRLSSLADELGAWLQGHETWGATLRRTGIDPVQDLDRLLAVAPTSDPAESLVFARHRLTSDRIRQAVGRLASDGDAIAWRQVQGFDAARIPVGSEDARVVVLTAPHELVMATPGLFDRVLRVASDQRARRAGDELVEPALAFENGMIAAVVAHRLTEWARERLPNPPPDALDVKVMDDPQAPDRVHVHASGTYADPAAAAAAGNALTEQRDFYSGHMLVAATGLNDEIGETEIQTTGNALHVRTSFTESDIERVIGMVAMMRQFGR